MLPPSSKASTLLIIFVLLTACSTGATAPQPTQKAITVEVPTSAPTLVPTPLPTKVPAETPADPPPTVAPTAAPEDPELNRKFGAAVQDYIRESWGGWDEGEFIGQCLIDNATSITATAREAIIQHGIDDAFGAVSGNNLASLSMAWDLCEIEVASAEEETASTAETDSTPELDAAFVEAVNTYLNSAWSDWATFVCFMAIPVGLVAGWCIEAWRTRNYTDRDWQKMSEKR